MLRHERELRRQVVEVHEARRRATPGTACCVGELGLDLVVGDDAALRGVDEEDLARLEPALAHDLLGRHVEHADLRRHDHAVVVGDPVARRAQAVAVEHRADHGAVGERDRRRTVPRLHQRRVVAVERLALGVHASWFSHASGIIIRIAWCSGRPARLSSSSASSKRAVSDEPGVQIGNARVEIAGQQIRLASRLRGRASSSRCPAPC